MGTLTAIDDLALHSGETPASRHCFCLMEFIICDFAAIHNRNVDKSPYRKSFVEIALTRFSEIVTNDAPCYNHP